MNTRTVKYAIVAVLLAVFIAASLMTSTQSSNYVVSEVPISNTASPQPANSIVLDAPTLDLTSPQPQVTRPAPYVPESEPSEVEPPSQPVPQQVVIQFEPQTTDTERQEYIESIGGTVVESIDSLDTVIINVSEETATQPLPESAKVAASEPDYYVTALDDLASVNDPRYTEQWALPAIGAPSAWAELPADAPKVTVAVIDSGICASHPDLAGRILDGWDFLEGDATPQDDFGHGCSVSGVIAANMNDGIGIAGVAPNAQILPLRVLNASGVGSYSDVAAAIVYAADNGAQVINLSLGGSNPSSTLENAVNYAISKGVIVVAAAGNSGVEGALYPAAYPDVIAVGSVDPNLQHSSFSNYGSQIDIWAPGRDILTTKRDGSYGLVSGTSFAAPYVAGIAAIDKALSHVLTLDGDILSFRTNSIETITPTITITSEVTQIIFDTVTPEVVNTPTKNPTPTIDSNVPLYDGLTWVNQGTKQRTLSLSGLDIFSADGVLFESGPHDPKLASLMNYYFPDTMLEKGWKHIYFLDGTGFMEILYYSPASGQYLTVLFGECTSQIFPEEVCTQLWVSLKGEHLTPPPEPATPVLSTPNSNSQSAYSNPLPVPFLSQRSYSGNLGYGDSSCHPTTIYSAGCYITAMAMIYNYYQSGFTDPGKLNDSLKIAPGLYAHDSSNGCYDLWPGGVPDAPSGVTSNTSKINNCTTANCIDPQNIPLIDNELNAGRPLHVRVHKGGTYTLPTHSIVIIGHVGNDYVIRDPWALDSGQRTLLSTGELGPYVVDRIDFINGTPPNSGGGTTAQCDVIKNQNGVRLFDNTECNGNSKTYTSATSVNLVDVGFNDVTHSIQIGPGFSVRVWQDVYSNANRCMKRADTGGSYAFWDLYKDYYDSSSTRIWNSNGAGSNITSIKVYANEDCTEPVALVDNATFRGQSSYLTVDPGQNFSIYFEIQNSGTSTWQTGSYWLQNLETSLGAGSQQGLGSNVSPNGTKRWDINMTAPSTPGTYRTSWMVNHNGTNFGPYMFIDVTVRQPSTCSQLANEVRLYDQINCPSSAGKVTNGGTGLWDISSSFNDRAQSIEVPLGYSARLYKDNTESSPSVCVDNSDVNLRDNIFSDGSSVASSTGAGATWVRIYNQDGCPASAPVTPVNFRQLGSTLNSLTIAWDDVTNETSYKIYEWNGTGFVYLASVGANQTTYIDTRYGCGRDQFYEVSAYNNAGESEHTGWIHAYTQACPTVANDDFNNAILIGGAPYNNTQTTAFATEAGDDPVLNCEFFSANKFNTVWYRYTPNASGTLTVNTFGSGYDTVLGIWTGLRGSLQQQGCNDDVEAGNNKSQLITSVTSGTTYYFEIAGYSTGDEGALALSVNLDAKPNPPTLVSPTILPILNSRTVTFNWNASSSSNVTGYVFRLSQYSNPNTQPWLVSIMTSALTNMYTFPSDGQFYWHVQSTSTNQNSDWVSQVFGIDSLAPTVAITAPASSSFLGTNQITITASASDTLSGVKNLVFFVGYDSVAGAGALVEDNSSQSYAPPLENPDDLESQGSNVTSQAWSWLQLGSDTNGSDGWSMTWDASTVPDQANVAFYVYAYDSPGNVQGTGNWGVVLDRTSPISNLNWLPTYSSPSFNVSWGGSDTLTGIDSFDIQYQDNGGAWTNWLSATTSSSATFNGTASHTYTFRSRARDGAGNTSTYPVAAEIQTTVVVSPLNDNFNAAQVISALPLINPSLDTRGASTASDDPILPTNCSNLSSKHSNSVWYKYTTPANGLLEIGTWGSDYDTVLAVWTGTAGNLSLIQCNDDLYGYMQAWLQEVPVSAGIIYYIEVMDYGNPSGGDLQLYVDFAQSPTNDDFNSAPLVTLNPFNATLDTRGTTQALDDPGLTSCNRNPGRNSVWYKYIPTWNGELQLDTKGSNYDTLLAVWTGARGSLISIGCNDDIGDVNGTWDPDSILTVPVTVGTTYYIEVSTYNGRIDINGASTTELVEKPDEIGSESATSLEDIKEQLENSMESMSGLQEGDLEAQFWGGMMILNGTFVPGTPGVTSSVRTNSSPTNVASVNFAVNFSEPVTGVDVSDFSLTTTGVSSAAVSGVSGSGSVYTVSVNTGSGNGTIRLDVVDDDSIVDDEGNKLGGSGTGNGNFTSGESYTLNKSATFADVPLTYWASSYIERLFNASITGGCGIGIYCPDSTVTRAQMAIFLLKGIHGSSYAPPAVGANTGFDDVATDYWAAAWIKQLAAEGITSGCGAGIYCPDATVTRAQMAVFLLKAKNGSSYGPPAVGGSTGFADVATDAFAAAFIKQLVAEGITAGCGNSNYCPDDSVTRAQMAVFLVRTFNLP